MRLALAFCLLVSTVLRSTATATPLVEPHVGGIGFVGPTSAHPTSTFWNPAALAQPTFSGSYFYLQTGARLDSSRIQRASIDPTTGEPPGSVGFEEVSTHVLTPGGFLAIVSDGKTDRYRFGFSLYAPFAERLGDAGDPLAYHARGGSAFTEYGTISLAVRATSQIFFGFGISGVWSQMNLDWDRDRALEDEAACPPGACPVEDRAYAERTRTRSDLDWRPNGLGLNLGVLVVLPPVPRLRLGVAYVSYPTTPGNFNPRLPLEGSARIDGHELPADGGAAYRLRGSSRVSFRLPHMVHAGARYQLGPTTDLVFTFRWLALSQHDNLDVRISGPEPGSKGVPEWVPRYRGLRDVYSLEGGVEHGLASGGARFAGMLRLESSAVKPSHLAPHQLDAPRAELALAGELQISPSFSLSLGYAFGMLLPTEATRSTFSPSAAFACQASEHELDTCEEVREGRAVPTAAGKYSRMTHQLTLSLGWRWL